MKTYRNYFLKSAINQDNSVHIGSRIFTFYPEGGITIVLNNDWTKYNSIKILPYNSIQQSHNVFVTSNAYYNIDKIYTVDSLGNLLLEKPYVIDTTIFASPLFCDFSDQLIVTQLSNGNVRIDFPHSKPYDIYEWTFEDGSKSYAYPLVINCSEKSSGFVELNIWLNCPECPSGKRRICWARVKFECKCGEERIKNERWESNNAGGSGKAIRIDASIWVRNSEVGCRSNLFGKGLFGRWYPMNWVMTTNGVCVDIQGTFKKEKECQLTTMPLTTKCLKDGQSNASIKQRIPQFTKVFRDPNQLSSGHRVRKLPGAWCGFGIDRPRLVLD